MQCKLYQINMKNLKFCLYLSGTSDMQIYYKLNEILFMLGVNSDLTMNNVIEAHKPFVFFFVILALALKTSSKLNIL